MTPKFVGLALVGVLAAIVLACGRETVVQTVVVEKQVPVERVVKETVVVQKEVPVEKRVVQTVVVEQTRVVEKVVQPTPTSTPLPKPPRFQEAPMLAERVKKGELPPVEKRLPENPLVINVFEEIGKYGGTMRRVFTGSNDGCNYSRLAREGITRYSHDGNELRPNLAESWESTPDQKVWTVRLRKGLKWSDGQPLTADDFVYQYEEVTKNKELNPNPPSYITAGGKLGTVSKIDDVTVVFAYPEPNPLFPQKASEEPCAHAGTGPKNSLYAPAHYLKQFHKKFTPNANELAKKEGFDTWVQMYIRKSHEGNNPKVPTTRPWVPVNDLSSQRMTAVRNPYYHAVDPKGNQLPYIDQVAWDLVEDPQVIQVKAASGEIDFQYRHIQTQKFPVFKENEQKAGIRVLQWGTVGVVANSALFFNQSFQGPEGDILRNAKFRQALSIAINRNEINEITYLGLAEPRQPVPAEGHAHSPGDKYVKMWTQYDPTTAKKMLDEILPNKDGEGFRLMPNGQRLLLVVTASGDADEATQAARFWEAVGVKTKVDLVARATLTTRNNGNEYHVIEWSVDTGCCVYTEPGKIVPVAPTHLPTWAPFYAQWYVHDRTGQGDKGIEPPADIKELQSIWEKGQISPTKEADLLAQEIYKRMAENVWIIGLVGRGVTVAIANKDLGNVPKFAVTDWPMRGPSTAYPEQFFFRNPK